MATTQASPAPATQAYPQWEYDLLSSLGAPDPKSLTNSLKALNYWAQSENTPGNPLAVSGQYAGATRCVAQCGTTSPIYIYDTEADYVAAMSKFMQGSNYDGIRRALLNNSPLTTIYGAINSSKWCTGCQGGKYPTVLAKAVGGGAVAVQSGTGSSLGPAPAGSCCGQCDGNGNPLCKLKIVYCVLNTCNLKALKGGFMVAAGSLILAGGILVLVAAGFKGSGATAAAGVLKKSPGGRFLVGIGGTIGGGGGKSAPRPTAPAAPKIPTPDSPSTAAARRTYAREGSTSRREYNRFLAQGESRRPRPITPRQVMTKNDPNDPDFK